MIYKQVKAPGSSPQQFDFTPYLTSLNIVFDYGMNVKETVIDLKDTFYNQHKKPHKRYKELLDMTIE